MSSLFNLLIVLIAGFWLFAVSRDLARQFKHGNRFRWILAILSFLVLIGAGGFFAAALSAMGVIKLPASREWPAGYVNGVVTTGRGDHIVPLMPSGRIQLYDAQWHFIRGWNVDAAGGDFKVEYTPEGLIEVFTARGSHHYSFTEDGRLIVPARTLPETFASLPRGESVVVPTSPLFWVFSSPFLSLGLSAIGFIGLAALKKIDMNPA
jgi:hypothetical protein